MRQSWLQYMYYVQPKNFERPEQNQNWVRILRHNRHIRYMYEYEHHILYEKEKKRKEFLDR